MTLDGDRSTAYFADITSCFPTADNLSTVLVTHVQPGIDAFVHATEHISSLRLLLPKPRNIDAATLGRLAVPLDALDRSTFADPEHTLALLEGCAAGERVAVLDVGGYFAPTLGAMCERFSGQISAVIEDTENGHRRYEDLEKPPCPIVSVARSPLKTLEDLFVGQAIVFSTEAILREYDRLLHNRTACVIGYGRLGSAVADGLRARHVRVTVYDRDPVRLAHAVAHGFTVAPSLTDALAGAQLVMCATGNRSLRGHDFAALHPGAYLASVTSSDDELEFPDTYQRERVGEHIVRYVSDDHHFHALNGGDAVNFVHGGIVGPFIRLVQAEILAACALVSERDLAPGFYEVSTAHRRIIANTWLAHYVAGLGT